MESQNNQPGNWHTNDFGENTELDGIKPITSQQFQDKFLVEPKPAVDGGTGATPPPPPPEPPVQPGEPKPQPVFTPPDTPEEEQIEIKKWSKEDREKMQDNLEMMLNFRSLAQAEILSWMSGEASEKYELDEEQMNRLARVYAPYMRKWGNKIPDWFWLVLAEGIIMTPIVRSAIADRKVNRANAALAGTEQVQQAVQAAAAAPKERKNYSIDDEGRYLKDARSNKYIKQADRKEKANLQTDLARVLEDNDIDAVRRAFPNVHIPDPAA